jgi:hypothetical protein
VIGEGIADASALKMCFGALNKGTQALWLEVLIAAQRLGVADLLDQQLRQSQGERYGWVLGNFPSYRPRPIAGCLKCSGFPRPWTPPA